jgi:ankyrin repeat protein
LSHVWQGLYFDDCHFLVFLSVCSVLLQGGGNLNSQDFDGWTPLHAAAHWGQKEACEMLVEEFCDMDMKNYVVGNYMLIKFKIGCTFPVHMEFQQFIKYERALYPPTTTTTTNRKSCLKVRVQEFCY